MLRSGDFCVHDDDDDNNDRTDHFTPCACVRSNYTCDRRKGDHLCYIFFKSVHVMVNDLSVLLVPLYHCFCNIISHRCVCRYNIFFLYEGKDIPQEISVAMAVEGGKLLLQQLEVR